MTVLNSNTNFQVSTGISHCIRISVQCIMKPTFLRKFESQKTTGQLSPDHYLKST